MLNGTNGVTRGSMAATFANKVSAAGYNAGIYANLNWWNNYLTSSVFGKYIVVKMDCTVSQQMSV